MAPTCLASTVTWVLPLGSWKTISPWASTFATDTYTALAAIVPNAFQSELQGMNAILLAVCSICQAFSPLW